MRDALGLLPQRYAVMVREGRAALFVGSNGTWFCYDRGCFRLFRKFETFALDLVRVLSDRCMTLSELARVLALDYRTVKDRVYYYHYSGLLRREGPFYCLNDDHPQIVFFLKLVTTRQFSDGENRRRLASVGEDLTGSILVSERRKGEVATEAGLGSVSSVSLDSVLRRAKEIARGLSPCEEALVKALYLWWRERGRLYVDTCDEVKLLELLEGYLGSGCRDSLELREALARLIDLGIVYPWPSPRRCLRIRLSRSILPVGKKR